MKSTHLVVAAAFCAAIPLVAQGDEPGPNPETLFDQLDKNKDGSVAGDEVGDEQKKLFERLVRRGDKDSDGKLTKEEFVQGTQDDKKKKPADERGERGERRGFAADPDATFERLDKNGDGKLTIDELPDQARERMEAVFERLGKDELSRDEFRRVAESRRRRFEAAEGSEGDRPPRPRARVMTRALATDRVAVVGCAKAAHPACQSSSSFSTRTRTRSFLKKNCRRRLNCSTSSTPTKMARSTCPNCSDLHRAGGAKAPGRTAALEKVAVEVCAVVVPAKADRAKAGPVMAVLATAGQKKAAPTTKAPAARGTTLRPRRLKTIRRPESRESCEA
jgi:hypothetical protein